MTINIQESPDPLNLIRLGFNNAKIGELIAIQCLHPSALPEEYLCGYLPDQAIPPRTFSFKQTVTDALNAICPKAPDNFEELPSEVQIALGQESEGQGFWRLISYESDEYLQIIRVKKI